MSSFRHPRRRPGRSRRGCARTRAAFTTGPISTDGSSGSPTCIASTCATHARSPPRRRRRRARRGGSAARSPARSSSTAPSIAAIDAATSRSASGNTMLATCRRARTRAASGSRPPPPSPARAVAVPPVNDTLSMPAWPTSASPAAAPPTTTLSTPGGSPASSASSAKRSAPNGASSGGLATTVLPAASAGAAFWPMPIIGPFHGTIAADDAVRLGHDVRRARRPRSARPGRRACRSSPRSSASTPRCTRPDCIALTGVPLSSALIAQASSSFAVEQVGETVEHQPCARPSAPPAMPARAARAPRDRVVDLRRAGRAVRRPAARRSPGCGVRRPHPTRRCCDRRR